ncbi:MAG TPA: arylsulfatase [Thermoguttaceae bacterium]|nr:arylsulfatase [Thermoguttaceae bacterium]
MRIAVAASTLLALGLAGRIHPAAAQDEAPKPNVIIMMADDMGFSDIGCYGGEIQTPNIDQLAAGGLRFTQFYNTARCCPTRACLLTGLYSHQSGVGHMMNDRGFDGFRGDLNENCLTIAQVMKTADYATYMAGKWHVTRFWQQTDSKHNWPLQRGFDRYYGTIQGAGSFFDPYTLTDGNESIVPDSDDYYYTDAIADNAAKFISEHEQDRPFFMYVAFTSPHWPMHAKEQDIAKYKGRYDQGWDALRAERHRRMIEMGIVDAKWEITPRDPAAPAWEDADLKPWFCRRMEVYAAMVDCMDQGIGRIVEALKKTDQLDNTLILFLADNGGCAEEYGGGKNVAADPDKPVVLKPMAPGELQTRMQPSHTRDGRPVRVGRGVMPGPADTFIAYGLPWANASNTPFRLYKHWVHEGGISSPLVAHWPEGISAERHGKLYHEPGHLIDLMATCVDMGGADYPQRFKGHEITPMQGVSLRPAFTGESLARPTPIFWEHEGNRAIREGKWKLVAKGANGPWELYDIQADRTELNNLAEEYPDRVEAMAERWEAWAIEAKAKPWPYGQ